MKAGDRCVHCRKAPVSPTAWWTCLVPSCASLTWPSTCSGKWTTTLDQTRRHTCESAACIASWSVFSASDVWVRHLCCAHRWAEVLVSWTVSLRESRWVSVHLLQLVRLISELDLVFSTGLSDALHLTRVYDVVWWVAGALNLCTMSCDVLPGALHWTHVMCCQVPCTWHLCTL